MRVRRASTRARRVHLGQVAVVCLVALAVTTPEATASRSAAPGAVLGAGVARSTDPAQPQVTELAVPAVSVAAAAKESVALGDVGKVSGTLVAHLRAPSLDGFDLVGVTWDHTASEPSVSVAVRANGPDGWSEWTPLDTDHDGGPASDLGSDDVRDGTEPLWVGDATGLEVAVFGMGAAPSGLQVSAIDPGSTPTGYQAAAKASSDSSLGRPGTFPRMPKIVTRKQWGADESLGDACWDPKYGRTFKAVVVHHTAGSNDYSRRESPALVRGILAYHTESRGWCDIGYNFLIDRFGTVFEGRSGGIRQPVRGAHAGDYNVNTTGISLMGNFDTAYPTRKMKQALLRMATWRLGTAYHGGYGKPFVFDRKISRISGHRDVMPTACPGAHVYEWLPRLRHLVNERLGGYKSRIQRYWAREGGVKGDLGPVRIGERAGAGGHYTAFVHGRVYVSDAGLQTLMKGPILKRYLKAGEVRGDLGYPRTNVRAVADDEGYSAEFQGGRIYWSKGTGSQIMRRGVVLKKYRDLRAAAGRLGFPISDVYDLHQGSRAKFEHGTITFSKATKSVVVRYR